ncbi:MAG TPA: hypothetical protein VFN09_01145, partial [Rhodanobacteraceae bacterium]|nr:hypothetical protein [Rhodanobacteraceae bacterium]
GSAPATMFRTHPPSAKRNQAAQQLIAQLAPSRELLDKPILPIASADAVAIAADEIQHENAAALAAVLDPGLGEVPAAALAPIGSVGFDDYAALANEVQYVGQSKALAHHKLSKKRLDAINEGFTARMQASPALRERYTIAFYRATQGRFAAYGRDLADSYAKHQDLHFEPPFPLQRMLTLNAALAQADGELDPRVLAAAGLTSYEAMIGRAWWMRKAMVLALTGDTSLITRLRAAARGDSDEQRMTQAESAGVRIGGNVHVGEGVHVGSRSGANGSSVGAEP